MKIRVTSTNNLISFLKKLKVVDKSILLELTDQKIFCKVHTPDKAVMKFASVDVSQVFDSIPDWETIGSDRIKIGLLDATRLMDCFKHFRTEEDIFLNLTTALIEGDCVATELQVVSNSLTIKIRCADLSLLSYVEDSILKLVHSKDDALCNFKIYSSDFSSVMALCGMESNSEELLAYKVEAERVKILGDSFDYKLNIGSSEIVCEDNTDAAIYKSHMNYVDSETSTCYIHDNRIVFFSDQTETSTAVGIIEE